MVKINGESSYSSFLGFKKTENGIEIDEEQAKTVRLIYRLFLLEGMTTTGIAHYLNDLKIPTPRNGSKWLGNNIMSILKNEKYKGDALLQKKFTTDFLSHKMKENEGEIPQYYVHDCLLSIVSKEEWDMVQTELERRLRFKGSYSGNNSFSTKLICGDCGGFYGKKIWHSTDIYKKEIYRCNDKFNKEHQKCQTPILTEDKVKALFIKAYNELLSNKSNVIEDAILVRDLLANTDALDRTIEEQSLELEIVGGLVDKLIKENCNQAQNQEEYLFKYDELSKRFEKAKGDLTAAQKEKSYKQGQSIRIDAFIERLSKTNEFLIEWDQEIWNFMLETATVNRDESITFKFKNGTEITEK